MVFFGLLPAQGGSHHLTVRRLPLPTNVLLTRIEEHDDFEQLVNESSFRLFYKSLMQRAAEHMKPLAFDRFPLASGPQDIPDAVDHIPNIHPQTTCSQLLG